MLHLGVLLDLQLDRGVAVINNAALRYTGQINIARLLLNLPLTNAKCN